MIKKYILGLGIGLLSFIGFSSALTLGKTYQNGGYISMNNSIDVAVYSRGMLSSDRLGNVKRMIVFGSNSSSSLIQRKYFWWNNGMAYFYWYYKSIATSSVTTVKRSGYFTSYGLCDPITGINNSNITLNCSFDNWGDGSFASDFFNSITSSDYWGYYNTSNGTRSFNLCFSSSSYGKSICFISDTDISNNYIGVTMDDDIDYVDFPNSLLGDPPGWSTAGGGSQPDGLLTGGGIEVGSDYSAINYYEKTYGWDKSICYAGVNSLDYLYGQNGVSFNEGQGLSIFDVFENIYGNTDLDKLYVWLNVQLFNYQNWFNINGNNQGGVGHPSWLGSYNSGTNQIDLYYDNLEFPFLNKPVAFYFLADNITSQSPYLTMGSSVVSYCNIKINSGSYGEIIDQADKNNITNYTEKFNTNQALNPDGTQKDYTGYWVGSGVDLAFSGNVSIKNTLKNFFDEFDKGLSVVDINTNNRILPTWIVSAFIFVVLFKFLRKR